ncbi:MAG: hypothetical protein GY896_24800 [Gammaproteobacteria bacterium]|nr:hypothetical protein [Gammaproteobacteria bacterium]
MIHLSADADCIHFSRDDARAGDAFAVVFTGFDRFLVEQGLEPANCLAQRARRHPVVIAGRADDLVVGNQAPV